MSIIVASLPEYTTMRGRIPVDPQTSVSQERYAVIYAPKRNRNRFPAPCVDVVDSAESARAMADADANKFPARVIGPSKSSEGQYIYYLVDWLDT